MSEKTISDREAEQLRKKIAFITRDGGYRTVITDSESADGIMPRCMSPDHPEDDREQQWTVYACCETDVIEMGHEHMASLFVDSLYVIPALLDERDQLRARIAELEHGRERIVLDLEAASNKCDQEAERVADERSPLLSAQSDALWDAARRIREGGNQADANAVQPGQEPTR